MSKVDAESSEDDVRRAAEIREWLEGRIGELEAELARLRDMQMIVDSVLRKTSFVPATELRSQSVPQSAKSTKARAEQGLVPSRSSTPTTTQAAAVSPDSPRQLRRSKDGLLLANAFVTPDKVIIVPVSDVKLPQTVPPFQTFFVNRILKGYETKDQELVSNGKLDQKGSLSYSIDESEGVISKVTVTNYRDKARLNEILSTINWAFTRMLEKK